jgi:hypothetical protein
MLRPEIDGEVAERRFGHIRTCTEASRAFIKERAANPDCSLPACGGWLGRGVRSELRVRGNARSRRERGARKKRSLSARSEQAAPPSPPLPRKGRGSRQNSRPVMVFTIAKSHITVSSRPSRPPAARSPVLPRARENRSCEIPGSAVPARRRRVSPRRRSAPRRSR